MYYKALIVFLLALISGGALSNNLSVNDIKTAFILKMALFIEWPENSNVFEEGEAFTICVQHPDKRYASLEKWVTKGKIKDKQVDLLYIGNNLSRLDHCNVLYFSDNQNLQAIVETASDYGVLTISDIPGNAQRGVLINFLNDEEKIRFEINLDAAKKLGFNINPRLLKLATIVREY